jgi:hypothetical protein
MVTVLVNEEVYVECAKCGRYKKPVSYTGGKGKKKKKLKSCSTCRGKK